MMLLGFLLTALSVSAAPSSFSLTQRQASGSNGTLSDSTIVPIRIIAAGYNSSYAVLEFNPYVKPNTLKVGAYYNTSEGNQKAWLSRHPINPNLVLGANDYAVPNGTGYLTSYALNPTTGQLTYIDKVNATGFPVPDYGVASAYCTFFPDGKTAGVANYFGQNAATFQYDYSTGRFGNQTNTGLLDFPGYTPVAGQIGTAGKDNTSQATAHPHMLVPHPFLPVLYIPDLGTDLLRIYNIRTNGSLSNYTTVHQPLGSGPRHLAITSSGRYMFLLHELSASMRAYSIDQTSGNVTQIGNDVPIYPPNATFSLNLSAAEVHASNDGRFLYASNRNLTVATVIKPNDPSDTIAVWSIGNNGTLTRLQSAMATGARQIRAMELSPAGTTAGAGGQQYIVAGSLKTNRTYVFKRDRLNGTLEEMAYVDGTYAPATYLWL